MSVVAAGHKLVVHVIRAEGLHHMNHFIGDHPYVVCEVKHADNRAEPSRAETKPVTKGDTLNPVWNEMLELDRWQVGEALEITVYDKGLLGSKTEGKMILLSEFFFPHGFNGMVGIPGLPDAKLHMTVQIMGVIEASGSAAAPLMTYEASPMTYTAPNSLVQQPTVGEFQMDPVSAPVDMPQKLAVSILEAHGLQHMNHFTGDHPYVVCEVYGKGVKVETKPMTEGDTTNPFWGETHTLDPWCVGDSLEFTIYDKGLLDAKTEGKVFVPPEVIYPHGFSGMLVISGLPPQAMLHVIIRPLGPSTKEETLVTADASKAKKKKKLKVGKKSKGCC